MNPDTIEISSQSSQQKREREFYCDSTRSLWPLAERLQWLEGFGIRIDQHADELIKMIEQTARKNLVFINKQIENIGEKLRKAELERIKDLRKQKIYQDYV